MVSRLLTILKCTFPEMLSYIEMLSRYHCSAVTEPKPRASTVDCAGKCSLNRLWLLNCYASQRTGP